MSGRPKAVGAEDEDGNALTIAEGPALRRLVAHHLPDRAEAV
jgi:hypothetical protein